MHVVFAEPNNHTEGMTLTRKTLNGVRLKQTALKDAESSGDIKIEGDKGKLEELMSYMDDFDIVTP